MTIASASTSLSPHFSPRLALHQLHCWHGAGSPVWPPAHNRLYTRPPPCALRQPHARLRQSLLQTGQRPVVDPRRRHRRRTPAPQPVAARGPQPHPHRGRLAVHRWKGRGRPQDAPGRNGRRGLGCRTRRRKPPAELWRGKAGAFRAAAAPIPRIKHTYRLAT